MGGKTDPRNANGNARRKLRARIRALGLPCHICGGCIDYSLPAGHPMSFEVDEIVPVSKGGSPLDFDNCAPAHRICNQRRGNRPIQSARAASEAERPCRDASRDWLAQGGDPLRPPQRLAPCE